MILALWVWVPCTFFLKKMSDHAHVCAFELVIRPCNPWFNSRSNRMQFLKRWIVERSGFNPEVVPVTDSDSLDCLWALKCSKKWIFIELKVTIRFRHMFVHPCCCICFIEWCFFKFKMVLKSFYLVWGKGVKIKRKKGLLSPSLPLGSAQSPSPPRPVFSPSSSFFCAAQCPVPGPRSAAQQAAPLLLAAGADRERTRALGHRQVGPSG